MAWRQPGRMRKHILISANPLRPEPAIRNDGGVVRDLVSVRFVANGIGHFWYPNTNVKGAVDDAKNANNGILQRLMSRADKLPVGDY